MDKKRPRENDGMEEDDELYYDQIPSKDKLNLSSSSDQDVDMNGEINVEFLFSELRDTYFHNIKTFLKNIFEFENINMSELADLILSQKEVGSIIKTELEEETGNQNIDALALVTILNMKYYKEKNVILQLKKYLIDKIEQYASEDQKLIAKNILDMEKIGFLINERAINLPMPLVPPLLNMVKDDIDGYNEEVAGSNKFDFEYVCMISKFVQFTGHDATKSKKRKTETAKDLNEIYYKFEDDYFVKESLVQLKYKIPYDKKFADFIENNNEPQYFNIIFMKASDFFKVVKKIQKEDLSKFQ